jgi:hypothetical protein
MAGEESQCRVKLLGSGDLLGSLALAAAELVGYMTERRVHDCGRCGH